MLPLSLRWGCVGVLVAVGWVIFMLLWLLLSFLFFVGGAGGCVFGISVRAAFVAFLLKFLM